MNGRKQQDEMLFCERCGISFLWTVEERNAQPSDKQQPAPIYCPGCRVLLPTVERERGEVKFFNGRKQFGFLTRRTGPELYVHGSALPPNLRLGPGDLVEFSVIQTERGVAASEVVLLEKAVSPDKTNR
jgi:CspA family cold shock protein